MKILKWVLLSFFILLVVPGNLYAAILSVTSTADTNTVGTLKYAILNSSPGHAILSGTCKVTI